MIMYIIVAFSVTRDLVVCDLDQLAFRPVFNVPNVLHFFWCIQATKLNIHCLLSCFGHYFDFFFLNPSYITPPRNALISAPIGFRAELSLDVRFEPFPSIVSLFDSLLAFRVKLVYSYCFILLGSNDRLEIIYLLYWWILYEVTMFIHICKFQGFRLMTYLLKPHAYKLEEKQLKM